MPQCSVCAFFRLLTDISSRILKSSAYIACTFSVIVCLYYTVEKVHFGHSILFLYGDRREKRLSIEHFRF